MIYSNHYYLSEEMQRRTQRGDKNPFTILVRVIPEKKKEFRKHLGKKKSKFFLFDKIYDIGDSVNGPEGCQIKIMEYLTRKEWREKIKTETFRQWAFDYHLFQQYFEELNTKEVDAEVQRGEN